LCDDNLWDRFLLSIDRARGAPVEAARILGNQNTAGDVSGTGLQTISASKILTTDFPPLRFIVPGLVVEGLTLLAGRPKIGKSWLALNLAAAVVSAGKFLGREVAERASVLYCALEDSPRRIKERLAILGSSSAPENLHFLFRLHRLDDGGAEALDKWLAALEDVRLVVVDVFNRIRTTAKPKGVDQYQHDAAEMAKLQAVAMDRRVSIVVLTHDRKAAAEDWLERVTGTLGIAGTADTVALLERDRGSSNGRLRITGRDLDTEPDLGLEFTDGLWHFIGPGETLELTPQRRKILDALRGEKDGLGPSGIAKKAQLSVDTVKPSLPMLIAAGLILKVGTGRYVTLDTPHTQHTPNLLDGVSRV
jgi:hypothetical protein